MVAARRLTAIAFVAVLLVSAFPMAMPTAEAASVPAFGSTLSSWAMIVTRPGLAAVENYTEATYGALRPGDQMHFYWNITWTAAPNPACSGPLATVSYNTTAPATADASIVGGGPAVPFPSAGDTGAPGSRNFELTLTYGTSLANTTDGVANSVFVPVIYRLDCGGTTPSTQTGLAEGSLFKSNPVLYTAQPSTLTRTQIAKGDVSASNSAVLNWLGGAAQISLNGAVVNANTTAGTIPLGTNALTSASVVDIVPLGAGNTTKPASKLTYTFPTANVAFGPASSTTPNPAFVTGNTVGNLFVNLTGRTAVTYPGGATNHMNNPLWFQLIRATAAGDRYWQNDTAGSSESHFITPSQTNTNAAAPTRFQPAAVATPLNANQNILLKNLSASGRNFLEGIYTLEANLLGENGHSLRQFYKFGIDNAAPATGTARNYSSSNYPDSGMAAQSGVLHGSDGNPLRVLVNFTDSRADKDAGLRNVTVELIDATTHAPVKRTTVGLADPYARFNITPATCGPTGALPYCRNFVGLDTITSPAPTCPSTDTTYACDAYRYASSNEAITFATDAVVTTTGLTAATLVRDLNPSGMWKQFSGWVNLTWSDLPVGSYKVRLLASDEKGTYASSIPSTTYVVAPAVRIGFSPTSPALVGDALDVSVFASQRLSPDDNSNIPCDAAPSADVCPADYVEIFVTNDNTASHTSTTKVRKWDNRTAILAGARTNVDVNGYIASGGTYATNGSLTPTTNSIAYFPYGSSNAPALVSDSVIDVTKPLFVKARAVHVRSSGSRIDNVTDWIPVATSSVSGLTVNQPPTDWAFAVFGATNSKDRIAFNLTFDRRSIHTTMPQMRYSIVMDEARPAGVTFTNFTTPLANPLNSGANTPKVLYNWTGTWLSQDGTPLPRGNYTVHAEVLEGTELKAEVFRNFTILGDAPRIVINSADQTSPAINVTGTGNTQSIYARSEFDVAFQVEHGAMNLTSVDQITFNLTPASPRGSMKAIYGPVKGDGVSDDGFSVRLREGSVLTDAATTSYFNATVTIPTPSDVLSGDIFQLSLAALVDVAPWRVGNATALPRLVLDTEHPNATVRPLETAASVLSSGANPPRNADTPAPIFWGSVKDNASGVKRLEIRIVDTTQNKALMPSGDNWVLSSPDSDLAWIKTDLMDVSGTSQQLRNVYLAPPNANGVSFWQVNATNRWVFINGVEQNPTNAAPNGIKAKDMPVNLNTTYRVEVRATDNIAQVSDVRSTLVRFDGVGPTLGYNGALSTGSEFKSGIHAAAITVPWHGSATLTVNATDNNCLAVARLVGKSDLNPTTIVKANMTVVPKTGQSATQARCDKGQAINWAINLGDAPQMTNDVSNYTYWFEAEDTAGLVSEVAAPYRTFRMRVIDATPASVLGVLLNPPVAADGLRARIEANVVENEAIRNVTVVARYANNQTFIAQVEMKPDSERPPAANGTGWYVADTTDDLGITLHVGEYLFEVTARDINYNTTCNNGFCFFGTGLLRVVADAPPQVLQESPPRGTVMVGAQPTLKFQVLDRNVETTGVRVEAGNGTLTTVNATLTEIKATNGSRQGYEVAYTPATPFADGVNITVRVTASSTKGFVNSTSFNFTVDAMPPTVSANLTGNVSLAGKSWSVSTTSVNISSDAGASSIRYKVNGVDGPAYASAITPSGNDGDWRLEYWAVDTAGNSAPHQFLNLSIDKTGPVIRASRHGDDIIVTVDDAGVGVDEGNVTVHYSYGTDAFAVKKMDKLTGNSYNASLGGNASATGLRYWFDARDALGNVGNEYTAAAPYAIPKEGEPVVVPPENEAPTVVISNPTGTPTVTGSLEIRWVAQDPEGGTLAITIEQSEPAPGRVLVTGSDNSGSHVLNVSDYAPGTYTIVVTASDGEQTGRATASFVIAGEAVKLIDPPPATVETDEVVTFGVSIEPVGKTVQQATYTIVKAGRPVQSGQLRASDGVYVGSVTPAEPGDYRVVVSVIYSDGSTEPAKQVAQFRVAGVVTPPSTGSASFPVSLMAVVILAVIVVGLGGYGAFGRWKK